MLFLENVEIHLKNVVVLPGERYMHTKYIQNASKLRYWGD